jgi:hypothetical protein
MLRQYMAFYHADVPLVARRESVSTHESKTIEKYKFKNQLSLPLTI